MKYYHVTRKENLDSIMEKGLIAQIGANSEWIGDCKGVFLFTSIKEVRQALGGWLHLLFCDDWEIISLEVDLPEYFVLHPTNNEWEMRSDVDIPSQYIRFYSYEQLYDGGIAKVG